MWPKNFKNKSSKLHLEYSHKEEILDLEVRFIYKSENFYIAIKSEV